MNPFDLGLGLAVVIGSAGAVGVALMVARAVLRKWSQPPQARPAAEIRELRQVVTDLAAEVTELQERLDFAERMLARHEPPRALKGDV